MSRPLARTLPYLGAIGAVFGLGKAHAAWIGHYDFTGSARFAWSLAYVALLAVVAYGAGLPELVQRQRVLRSAAGAALAPTLAISVAQLVLGSAILPRFVVFLAPSVLIPWYAACVALGNRFPGGRVRVLAVVGADEAAALEQDVVGHSGRPCAVTVLDPAKASSREVGEGPLARVARQTSASVLVLNRGAYDDEQILEQAVALHAGGVRVRTLDRFYDEWLGKLPRHELGQASLLFDIGEVHRPTYNRMKRVIDAALGALGFPLLAVLTPAVVVLNLVGNRGPLLYRQGRVGRHGAHFTMYKFRTMRPGPSTGRWTEAGDDRVTRFGRWLRRTHLDELPQVINILRGDLATVGPRPEQPHYVQELTSAIPFYGVRHLVRPGLTGWAQVNYSYGCTELDAIEKLRYDLYYLQHQSVALDLRIVVRSLRDVMRGTGR